MSAAVHVWGITLGTAVHVWGTGVQWWGLVWCPGAVAGVVFEEVLLGVQKFWSVYSMSFYISCVKIVQYFNNDFSVF